MKPNIYHIINSILLIFICCSCTKDNSEELFYQNTQKTLSDLESIMYSNSSNPTTLKGGEDYERFKIVHISDVHLSKSTTDNKYTNPTNLKQAIEFANLKESKINALVASGDFINTNKDNDRQVAIKYLNAFSSNFFSFRNSIPSFVCTGNHDTNMLSENTSYYLSKEDLSTYLFEKANYTYQRPAGENYYYSDVNEPNGNIIRFIALDNTDQEVFTYNTLHVSCITQKQINWLINTALKENMTDKHSIIIITHHPLQAYSKDNSTYMCSGTHLYKETLIPSIINAFIQKKKFNASYQATTSPFNKISVNADFENSVGDFICYLGGHTHTPAHFYILCDGKQQIMLLANTMSPNLQNNDYGHITREENKANSNSFSIYAIDTKEKNIYITYFGAKKVNSPIITSISYR